MGFIAHRLRQPVVLGYLAAGIIIGPYGLGLVQNLDQVQTLAEVGVVLLMFAIGVEFSLGELKEVRGISTVGGSIQIVGTTLAVAALAMLTGVSAPQAIFFGGLIALSSTMIVLKTLMDRGELDALHGRILIGVLLVQDIAVIPLMIVLPALSTPRPGLLLSLGFSILQAAFLLGMVLIVGTRLIPPLMAKIAETRSPELFLLTVITLTLVAALGMSLLGLPLALGAFIAGLTVSESVFSQQVLADVIPLRNTFATLFFASVGMLTDPRFVVDNAAVIALVVFGIILGKFVISSALTYLFRYPLRTSFLVGAGLIQIGEFSFVMAREGVRLNVISEFLYSLTLAVAIITIVVTPFALSVVSPMFLRLSQTRIGRDLLQVRPEPILPERGVRLVNHVVICGFGSVGRELARALDRREFSYFVIDYDPHVIVELRDKGIPCLYGDSSNAEVLAFARLERARVLVVTIADPIAARLTVTNAAAINPKLDIVARVQSEADLRFIRNAPAKEFVSPEFEASMEIIRHTLHRFGVTSLEIQYLLNTLREEYYESRLRTDGD